MWLTEMLRWSSVRFNFTTLLVVTKPCSWTNKVQGSTDVSTLFQHSSSSILISWDQNHNWDYIAVARRWLCEIKQIPVIRCKKIWQISLSIHNAINLRLIWTPRTLCLSLSGKCWKSSGEHKKEKKITTNINNMAESVGLDFFYIDLNIILYH